jgi:hypothetical protein
MPRAKRQRVTTALKEAAGLAEGQSQLVVETVCPRLNRAFLERLMTYEEFHRLRWGDVAIADIFQEMLEKNNAKDAWCESELSRQCGGVPLRLIPADYSTLHRPVYSMPKVIRFAALCASDYVELDLVASHPRQLLAYAKEHALRHAVLQRAFGGRQAIKDFRESLRRDIKNGAKGIGGLEGLDGFDGSGGISGPVIVSRDDVKLGLNQLCYGSSLRDWQRRLRLEELPRELRELKEEVAGVVDHVSRNSPKEVWEACLARERPKLAALSVMCQTRERVDLDKAVALLPPHATVLGYLNDSVLCAPFDDVRGYVELLETQHGILIEEKPLPRSPAEYETFLQNRLGREIDKTEVSRRRLENVRARANAMRWLFDKDRDVCPHVSFVVGMEDELPVNFNISTGKTEYYDESQGHWVRDMAQGAITGKPISDLLKRTYFRTGMRYEQDARGKLRLAPCKLATHCNLFENSSFLSCIANVAVHHRGPHKPLDADAEHLLVFRDKVCFDFCRGAAVRGPPHPSMEVLIAHIPESPEKDELRKILAPLRELSMRDRNTQAMPHNWQLYGKWREALRLVGLLQRVEDALVGDNGLPLPDGTNNISEDLEVAVKTEGMKHECFRKCFLEPFNYNIHEAVQSIKIFTNSWNTKSYKRTEVVTIFDIGEGSTGKGTLKHLADTYGGLRTKSCAGYSATITAQALQQKTAVSEAPSEQLANFEGARVVFLDEAPSGEDARAMHMKVIHMIMSGNFITAARKFASESVFLFLGTLYLVCNGYWKSDQPLGGPDERRITGQEYCVKFVNKSEEELKPGELVKDGKIKANIAKYCPELSFWILAYFYIKQAGEEADVTLPRPPSAVAFRNHVVRTRRNNCKPVN